MRNLRLWFYGYAIMFVTAEVLKHEVNESQDDDLKKTVAEFLVGRQVADMLVQLRDADFAKRQTNRLIKEYNKLILWAKERAESKYQETQEEGA